MNIFSSTHLNSLYHHMISFLREKELYPLTPQQKKVAAVIAGIFTCLTVGYILKRCFRAKLYEKKVEEGSTKDTNKDSTVVKSDEVGKLLSIDQPVKKEELNPTLLDTQKQVIPPVDTQEQVIPPVVEMEKAKTDPLQSNGIKKKTLPNGEKWEGEWQSENQFKGKIIRVNGDVHEGEFLEGQLMGKGSVTCANKNKREGFFLKGELHGPGRIWLYVKEADSDSDSDNDSDSDSDNDSEKGNAPTNGVINPKIIKGEFKKGKLNGPGIVIERDKTIKRGIFEDGELNGPGETIEFGSVTRGMFKADMPDGEMEIIDPDRIKWKGAYSSSSNEVFKGKKFCLNGDVHHGKFSQGLLQGSGEIHCSSGEVLRGMFHQGELKKGSITRANGDVWSGKFVKGKLHGAGEIHDVNQKVIKVSFKNGELVNTL